MTSFFLLSKKIKQYKFFFLTIEKNINFYIKSLYIKILFVKYFLLKKLKSLSLFENFSSFEIY